MKSFLIGILTLLIVPAILTECERVCLDNEMQYFEVNKCLEMNGEKVCKTDDMIIYFGYGELTQTEIDSLANEL